MICKRVRSAKHYLQYLSLGLLFLTSCSKRDKASYLILAFDKLPSAAITCLNPSGKQKSGIEILCQDSVRFTHAYTTSPLSTPAVASILTGLYPFEHEVRNNRMSLNGKHQTLAEIALKQDYETSFFSGGPPILRKTGLAQGFSVFDDWVQISSGEFYRNMEANTLKFKNWLDKISSRTAFFSVIYFPDLLFQNNLKEQSIVDSSHVPSFADAQSKLDLQLFELFQYLKKSERWQDTYVFLIGLSGQANELRNESLSPLDLHSDNIQVAFLVKPPRKIRDSGLKWNVDENISLADIGFTLTQLLGSSLNLKSEFPRVSLVRAISGPDTGIDNERPLIGESGFLLQNSNQLVRSIVILGHDLFFFDSKQKYYNTLIDRMETTPISISENPFQETLLKKGFSPFPESALKGPLETDSSIDYLAQGFVDEKKWKELLELGQKNHNFLYQKIALINLGKDLPNFKNSCFDLYQRVTQSTPLTYEEKRACGDPLFVQFLEWQSSGRPMSTEIGNSRFLQSYLAYLTEKRVLKLQGRAQWIFDNFHPRSPHPQLTELVLSLPENNKINLAINKRMATPVNEMPEE